MTITDATYFSVTFDFVLQVGTLFFLVWLYRSTRVKPVLYNAIWHIFSMAWAPVSRYLNARTIIIGQGHPPILNVYVFGASELVTVTGTVLFIWMLVALVRWGHPRLFTPSKVVSPSPAA